MEIYCPLAAENGCLAPTLIAADMAALAALGPPDEGEAMFVIVPGRCRKACLHDVSADFGPAENTVDILPRDWRPSRT